VPAIIDTLMYDVVQQNKTSATFSKTASVTNYSGTNFSLDIKRKIQLLDKTTFEQKLKTKIPSGVHYVAYESINQIKNAGVNNWEKDSGLLSIWLAGMFMPSEETKVFIPFSPQADAHSLITDDYFGKIPADRLVVKDSVMYFRCDGKQRGKIGIGPEIAKPLVGSFDFKKNILTILIPEVHKNDMYVNSKWELHKEPYKGDVINSYNDGPLADGARWDRFMKLNHHHLRKN
jgi:hypothetical protein